MDALRGAAKEADHVSAKAWVDGKIVDQDHAVVSATSTGFQYGAGVFETIRVDRGTIFRLPEHVDRMEKAWQQLFSEPAPDITWKHVIQSLIRENNFEKKQVAVKLVVCRDEQKKGRKFFLAAFVREYVPRLELLGKTGLDLVTYPHPRQTPLADYKTLNYLFYEQAGRFARSQKADEAIILNPDQTISETHTAGLLAIQDKRVIVPASDHVLDSISLKFILTILSDQGYDIVRKRVSKSVFYACPNIVATNALMGAVKVLSIDGTSISHDLEICPMINELLFELSCLETAPEDKS
jgi:para-aminobenzoate synthetase component 1